MVTGRRASFHSPPPASTPSPHLSPSPYDFANPSGQRWDRDPGKDRKKPSRSPSHAPQRPAMLPRKLLFPGSDPSSIAVSGAGYGEGNAEGWYEQYGVSMSESAMRRHITPPSTPRTAAMALANPRGQTSQSQPWNPFANASNDQQTLPPVCSVYPFHMKCV